MNELVLFRLGAVALVVIWIVQIAWAARKPIDWELPRTVQCGIPLTRNLYLVAGVLGVIVGLVMFVGSLLVWP